MIQWLDFQNLKQNEAKKKLTITVIKKKVKTKDQCNILR